MIFDSDIFEKASPQIISSILPLTSRPLITLKDKIVAVGVQDDNNMKGFIDSSYYKISITTKVYTSDPFGGFKEKVK